MSEQPNADYVRSGKSLEYQKGFDHGYCRGFDAGFLVAAVLAIAAFGLWWLWWTDYKFIDELPAQQTSIAQLEQ